MTTRLVRACVVCQLAGAAAVAHCAGPIVSPAWLKQRLGAAGVVVLEVSWTQAKTPEDYNAGHVPGAIHLDTDDLENGYPRWQLRPVEELHRVIGGLGIGPRTTVVVYGKKTIAAARAWWVLHYAGVREVRMLNGGYGAWLRAGYAGETKSVVPVARSFAARVRDEALATTEYVDGKRASAAVVLADVRSRDEFLGEVSGYDYLDRKGRLPGAAHLETADDSAAIYQHADGTLREVDEIRRLWRRNGLPESGEIVFYCGTGWRSSLAFLYAKAMGRERVRNYSDGWAGWSTVYEREPGYREGSTPGWRQRSRHQ